MAAREEIVVLVPVPVYVTDPGLLSIVQVPVAGKLFKITLPEAAHETSLIVPIVGGGNKSIDVEILSV